MKLVSIFYTAILMLVTSVTHAAIAPLEGRLPATPGGTDYQAYYDPNLNITWIADGNTKVDPGDGGSGSEVDTWDIKSAWAASLVLGGVNGWRLPSADVNGDNVVINCLGGGVVGCSDNEMGYLYSEEGFGAAGTATPGPFIIFGRYWSGTTFSSNANKAWKFNMNNGFQETTLKTSTNRAFAVHDGDVGVTSIPESTTRAIIPVIDVLLLDDELSP